MNAADASARRANFGKIFTQMTGGALIGAIVAGLYLSHARDLRVADLVALVCAMVCVIAAVRVFGESFDAKALGRRLQVEGEGTAKEAAAIRGQAALMVALAIVLIWPPIATLNGAPASPWAYAVTFVFTAINVFYSWRMYVRADEFMRRRFLVTTWWASLIGQAVLLFYAGAERLGLVMALTAWDVLIGFTAITILVPLFVTDKPAS